VRSRIAWAKGQIERVTLRSRAVRDPLDHGRELSADTDPTTRLFVRT